MKRLLLICLMMPCIMHGQGRKQKKQKGTQLTQTQLRAEALKTQATNLQNSWSANGNADSLLAYISTQFTNAGLLPKDTNGFVATTTINLGTQVDSVTFLKVNGQLLSLNTDYFPLPFSVSKAINGMPSMSLREKNLPWFADIKDLAEDQSPADSVLYKLIAAEAERAAAKGATALFVYNTDSTHQLKYEAQITVAASLIPVVFVANAALKKKFPRPF